MSLTVDQINTVKNEISARLTNNRNALSRSLALLQNALSDTSSGLTQYGTLLQQVVAAGQATDATVVDEFYAEEATRLVASAQALATQLQAAITALSE
jgi:hypothetical protein